LDDIAMVFPQGSHPPTLLYQSASQCWSVTCWYSPTLIRACQVNGRNADYTLIWSSSV